MVEMLWISLALIIFGALLALIELMAPGETFLFIPGSFLVTLGLVGLASNNPEITFTWGVLAALLVAVVATIVLITILKRLGTTQLPQTTVAESLIGETGVVTTKVMPHSIKGKVRIGSVEWSAKADKPIDIGAHVEVLDSKGVHIIVAEIDAPKENIDYQKVRDTKQQKGDMEKAGRR